jgi:hypothetical protein
MDEIVKSLQYIIDGGGEEDAEVSNTVNLFCEDGSAWPNDKAFGGQPILKNLSGRQFPLLETVVE